MLNRGCYCTHDHCVGAVVCHIVVYASSLWDAKREGLRGQNVCDDEYGIPHFAGGE